MRLKVVGRSTFWDKLGGWRWPDDEEIGWGRGRPQAASRREREI
jgi:hypothetical protein